MKCIFRLLGLGLVLVFFLLPSLALAAGTVEISTQQQGKIKAVIFHWTVDASGDLDTNAEGNKYYVRGGTLYGWANLPGADVTAAFDVKVPVTHTVRTNNPDARALSITFADALGGEGQNLSEATSGTHDTLTKPFSLISGHLSLIVENAGVSKSGTFILFIWEE